MKRIFRIMPKYAYIPAIMCILYNEVVYHLSRIVTDNLHHYNFSLSVDAMIPYVPSFITIYLLSYPFWVLGFVVCARENRALCNEIFAAEFIAKTLCLLCFFIIPTEMQRADLSDGGIFNWATNITYAMDEPNNLFPSIHCMESWICFRGAYRCRKIHSCYTIIWFLLAVLICLSTVFVKQHLFLDIFSGILAAEIGLFLAKKWRAGRMYDVIRMKLLTIKKSRKKQHE